MTIDKTTLVFAFAAACLALSACSRKPLLRDWYVGRETLEPGRYVDAVERDAWGRPILPDGAR